MLLLGLACIFVPLYLLSWWYFHSGELGDKEYYAVLQGVEYENRKDKGAQVLLLQDVERSGLNVVGIPTADSAYPRVWIAINREGYKGKILEVPESIPLKIRCYDLNRVLVREQIIESVRQYLSRECKR